MVVPNSIVDSSFFFTSKTFKLKPMSHHVATNILLAQVGPSRTPRASSHICTPGEMTRMVEGSFEQTVEIASNNIACFQFLRGEYSHMRVLHEWNAHESPEAIMSRVQAMHDRLVAAATERMREIPDERLRNGRTGHGVIYGMEADVARFVLNQYREVAVDLCCNPPPRDSTKSFRDGWYEWFRECVFGAGQAFQS